MIEKVITKGFCKNIFICCLIFVQVEARERNSFDVFDTLLGRTHYEPHSVFDHVEKKFPFLNFKQLRIEAERKSAGDLIDIYKHFKQITNVSEETCKKLMQFELETELKYSFPIIENVKQVEDGDLLISDTYYSRGQIEALIRKIGLQKQVEILAGPHGKSSGRVFEDLHKSGWRGVHLGDNPRNDKEIPEKHGIAAILYKNSLLNEHEKFIKQSGHKELAYFIRALRLQNPYPSDTPAFAIWNEQAMWNIPILVLSSFYIDRICKEYEKKKILFTTRGCCHLSKIFKQLFPHYESIYFHASRLVYNNPSHEYYEYVKEIYTDETLIVDEHGSGVSCNEFFKKYFNKQPHILILSLRKEDKTSSNTFQIIPVWGYFIEYVNYDTLGTLVGYNASGTIRNAPEYDLQYVLPAHACVHKALELLNFYEFKEFDAKLFDWLMNMLSKHMVTKKHIKHENFHFKKT